MNYLRLFLCFLPLTVFAHTHVSIDDYYAALQNDPARIARFLADMPKGADLHSHLTGASYAEEMLRYAKPDDLCINLTTYSAYVDPNCPVSSRLNTVVESADGYDHVLDAWSMRHFNLHGQGTPRDHFFQAFSKFSPIKKNHIPEMLAEVAGRAEKQHVLYLELMTTVDNNKSGELAVNVPFSTDFATLYQTLKTPELDNIVKDMSTTLTHDETAMRTFLGCNTKAPKAGCHMTVRYLYQAYREQPPQKLFAQLIAGFELAKQDQRVVGVNLVQAEHGAVSLRDYPLQMRMIGYLKTIYPAVHVSLHAGELTRDIAPEKDLKSHIHDAVFIAHAERIGHGVDILEEDDHDPLMQFMVDNGIMVEINLSSNTHILDVGPLHNPPLPTYLGHQVPVSLSTDDEGVNRSSITQEYIKMNNDYHLDYQTVKQMNRNSIMYAFLPGKALWVDHEYKQVNPACRDVTLGSKTVTPACLAFLDANQKAAMQWILEKQLNAFEGCITQYAPHQTFDTTDKIHKCLRHDLGF